jgi:WD40 repeat protein
LIIDLASGQRTGTFHGIADSSAVSVDGATIALAKSGHLTVFEGSSHEVTTKRGVARTGTVSPLIEFSPNGTRLAIWTNDGLVDVYDTATWQLLEQRSAADVTFVGFDDTNRVVTVQQDGTVQIWEIGSSGPPREFEIGSRVGTAAVYGNVIISSDIHGSWRAIDLDSGDPVHPPRVAHAGGINDIVVSNVDSRMATAGRDGTIKLWDLEAGTQLMALTEGGTPADSLAFSADGRRLVAIDDEAIRVYTLDVDRLIEIGRSRITRSLTGAECQQHFRSDKC